MLDSHQVLTKDEQAFSEEVVACPLCQCAEGECAVISCIETEDAELKCRLLILGLTQGTSVAVRQKALLGCPLSIEVRGAVISLRKSEAAAIKVSLG